MRAPALRSEPEPREHPAPDWLEAARQAFLWRYFYDDCRPLPPAPSAANPGVYRKNCSAFMRRRSGPNRMPNVRR
jgi:hypothetical protein